MKKARIIYNPTAGREAFQKELPNVLQRLEKAGFETSTHATTGEGDATEAAKAAAEKHFHMIVIAGGDGTLNEAIQGISEQDFKPTIGYIPTGTTNDFARALSIPQHIEKAVDIILKGKTMSLDVGKVNNQYFINIAGGGDLTELTYDVPIKLKTVLGRLAYYIKGIELLPSLKPAPVKIEYDGGMIEEDIMLFLIANTNSVGGFEKLAPDAKINDGLFDLIILKKVNLADFIRLATLALRGTHLESEDIVYAQTKYVKVTPYQQMQLNIDGEYGGLLPGEFINLKQHINFRVPKAFVH